ncbi:hypothetical protein [Lentzea sp. NPDC092896]
MALPGSAITHLRAAIGFGYTFVLTLLSAVASARLADQMRTDSRNRVRLG